MRITKKDLEIVIEALRNATGENIRLSQAYGGYNAVIVCENGGERDFVCWGHVSCRELYERMQAYKAGWYAAKQGEC
jgi:hypothetical protein